MLFWVDQIQAIGQYDVVLDDLILPNVSNVVFSYEPPVASLEIPGSERPAYQIIGSERRTATINGVAITIVDIDEIRAKLRSTSSSSVTLESNTLKCSALTSTLALEVIGGQVEGVSYSITCEIEEDDTDTLTE